MQTLSERFLSLARLLTHKIENTDLSPSIFSPFSPTAALNQAIQQELQAIRRNPLFPYLNDEDFNELFPELEAEVAGWGLEGGTTEDERVTLAFVMKDLGAVVDRVVNEIRETDTTMDA